MSIKIEGSCPLLMVFDMPRSVAFYRDLLGFEVVSNSGQGDNSGWFWLKFNGGELMLNTAFEDEHRPKKPEPARQKNHADTILYFGCPDVDEAYKYLVSRGLELDEPKLTGYGFRAIEFSDPDGYGIVFHWKN